MGACEQGARVRAGGRQRRSGWRMYRRQGGAGSDDRGQVRITQGDSPNALFIVEETYIQ